MSIFDIFKFRKKYNVSNNQNYLNNNINQNIEKIEKDEIELLKIIMQITSNLNQKLNALYDLNWKEIKNIDNINLYINQLKELQTILNAINDTIYILDYLKNYTRYFLIEAKNNQYIPPDIKSSLIYNMQTTINDLRDKINRIFLEFNILFDEFSRL